MFPPKVFEKLKFYVYLYIDPRTEQPFYIGKGKGNRAFSHLKDSAESAKVEVLKELEKVNLKPRIEILKYGLSEKEALLVESTAIDLVDVRRLTNRTRGHGSRHGARASVEELISLLDAKTVEIEESAILINITRAFRYGMTVQELYDATRSAWILGPKRENAKFALSVYRKVVREVYEISGWLRGGSTMRCTDASERREFDRPRWEFVGRLAPDDLRKKYIGRSVAKYIPKGAQNPILYVNC